MVNWIEFLQNWEANTILRVKNYTPGVTDDDFHLSTTINKRIGNSDYLVNDK